MHIKKFLALYVGILGLGLLALCFKDFGFLLNSQSQVAQVSYHVPSQTETYFKLSGSYEEKMLSPAISYKVNEEKFTNIAPYSCKDGCQMIGSPVTVLYHLEKPQDILIMNFNGFWRYKIYFLIAMGVLLLTALPYIYYNPKTQP